jgi:hypothetical protein
MSIIIMDDNSNYKPFLKAMSGADSVQARRFAAAKALEIGWGGVSKVSDIIPITDHPKKSSLIMGSEPLSPEQ